jgi:tetratricopeptide (TPR) repeat protein
MNAPEPSNSIPAQSPPATAALLDSVLRTADAHYQRQDWVAARDSLSLAVELAPDHVQARAALGSLQYQLQEYPAACASFTIATTQSPENPDLHTQLAMVHIKLEQADEAKAALQQALNLRPHHPTARQLLGDLHFAAKRYADAAIQYCALLESNSDGVDLLLHLGKCLYELRDLASARWCFERVIAIEPTNSLAAEALQVLDTKKTTAAVVPSTVSA